MMVVVAAAVGLAVVLVIVVVIAVGIYCAASARAWTRQVPCGEAVCVVCH